MPKTVAANINPKILIWAREEQGLSLSWVAEKFNVGTIFFKGSGDSL